VAQPRRGWFGRLSLRKLRRSSHRTTHALESDIRSYIECTNDEPKPFVWTKTVDDILASIARYCSLVVHATYMLAVPRRDMSV